MIRPTLPHALLAGAVGVALLGGCAGPAASGREASAAQKAACRQRANEVYAKQNRDELYRSDSYVSDTRDSPFSTSGLPGITTRGLGGEYARESLVSDCLNDAAGNVGSSTGEEPLAAGTAATPGTLPKSLSPLAVPPAANP